MTSHSHISGPAAPLIGGRYRMLEELGRGGTAVVYRVHDVSTGQELALKQLLAEHAAALFEREYHALTQLAHPRVIAVYDYGLDAAGRFYTMELLDGGDLAQLSPMPALRACRLMWEVCSSLALLHSRRLVHRDVTPRNVRCTRDGHAKLIDFGVMTPMGPCSHIAGTPAFIAPEVVHKISIDGRADLFSLGATLYYTLTGRPPYPVRDLSELREAYARELVPPSRLAAEIPPALDALCASLLRIDPGQRPRSAFEVMHKLAAIVGTPRDEPLGVSQAYLTTPTLCGREAELSAFRPRMRRAVQGNGSALLYRSAPGLGRSRLLDACALEAKTLGVTVLRARAGNTAPFACAARLGEQLVQALPDVALQAAELAQVRELLFDDAGSLRAWGDGTHDRERVQSALGAWLSRVCETHAVLVLVDDAPRVDEASLAGLAMLAVAVPHMRLQLTVTADLTPSAAASAWHVLSKHCAPIELRPLTHRETEALLGSVFGSVPHLPLLAERVYGVARGSPRESLLLAQHLVDAGSVSYRDGQWTLPAELRPGDLPVSAGDALRARIASLCALARTLAQLHALLGMRALRCDEYALLARDSRAADVERALLELVRADILQADGERYQLSHPTLAELLRRMLGEDEQRAHHLTLYEFLVRSHETHPYRLVPHLVAARHWKEAFDVMAARRPWLDEEGESSLEGLDVRSVADCIARMLDEGATLDLPVRELHELRRRLCALAVISDDTLHARVAPLWLPQLCRDSGLDDYRATGPQFAPSERLRFALEAAKARYLATPEAARVYTVEQAIRYLATYVVTSIVISVRTADTQLMQSLPALIEPFAGLSPALHAIWQNVVGLVESQVLCRRITAARRHREVFDYLRQLKGNEIPYVASICSALAHSVGSFEAYLGSPAAFEWAEVLDADPRQREAAMDIRRTVCLMRGDNERAQDYEERGELVALRTKVRRMFDRFWPIELESAVLTSDLANIKRVIDALQQLSTIRRGWQPLLDAAKGHFLLLRGEPRSALAAFDRSIAGSERNLSVWLQATTGSMLALSALGRDADAVARGDDALARCEAGAVELSWHRVARALALAEANLGQLERAVARIERVMASEERDGVLGLNRAATYETRAQVAIRARDVATAEKYARLSVQARGGEASAAARAHIAPLLDQARKHGLDVVLGPTQFERVVLGTDAPRAAAAPSGDALRGCRGPAERARRVLERLCVLARASSGQLFLVDADRELTVAAMHHAEPPSREAHDFVRQFFAQQLDDLLLSEVVTRVIHMRSSPGLAMYYGEDGVDRHLVVLSCKRDGELSFVGVAMLAANPDARVGVELVPQASALAAELVAAGDSPGVKPGGLMA